MADRLEYPALIAAWVPFPSRELLKGTERAKGGLPYQSTCTKTVQVDSTLSDLGVSKKQLTGPGIIGGTVLEPPIDTLTLSDLGVTEFTPLYVQSHMLSVTFRAIANVIFALPLSLVGFTTFCRGTPF